VKHTHESYLSNRVLKINVGFLLADGPGHYQDSQVAIPERVRVADDVLVQYIQGALRLTRTKEGILVQSQLEVGIDGECSRCLTTLPRELAIHVEELYMHPAPRASEFYVGADSILDLAPLLRAEVIIQAEQRVLCRPDCQGLCPECGANRNTEACACANQRVDPRLAALKTLLDSARQ
jgi:uncharacterized protein